VASAGVKTEGVIALPTLEADPAIAPLAFAQSFYRLANAVSIARGMDPDSPPHLQKVTRTH
jgi:glucosamine--fructose-6-phosphate aminotransferase (isomerizing)